MKFTDRIGALVMAYGLWMIAAFVIGLLARPVANAFIYGFRIWGD